MSESKAEYYAKHLQQMQKQVIVDKQVERIEPTGLPALLAQMVNEYHHGLDEGSIGQTMTLVEQFNTILLAAAQPLLTEYLHQLTNPPQFVVKTKDEDEELSTLTKEWARVRSGKL